MTTSHSARSRSFLIDALLSPALPSGKGYEESTVEPNDRQHQEHPVLVPQQPPPAHQQHLLSHPLLQQPYPPLDHHHPVLHPVIHPATATTAAAAALLIGSNGSAFPYDVVPRFAAHVQSVPSVLEPSLLQHQQSVLVKPVTAAAIGPRKRTSSVHRSRPVATARPAAISSPLMTSSDAIASSATRSLSLPNSNKCNANAITLSNNSSSNSNNNTGSNSSTGGGNNNKKKTGIPVGIAVARQRNNRDSQISPKSVVLVTQQVPIDSNSHSLNHSHHHHHPHHHQQQLMSSNAGSNNSISGGLLDRQEQRKTHLQSDDEKLLLVHDKISAADDSSVRVSDPSDGAMGKVAAPAVQKSVIAHNPVSGKLLLLIPGTGTAAGGNGSRSSTPISSLSESALKSPAISAALAPQSGRKGLTISTGEDDAPDNGRQQKQEKDEKALRRVSDSRITSSQSSDAPLVREEELLLKKVRPLTPAPDTCVDVRSRCDFQSHYDPVSKSVSHVTAESQLKSPLESNLRSGPAGNSHPVSHHHPHLKVVSLPPASSSSQSLSTSKSTVTSNSRDKISGIRAKALSSTSTTTAANKSAAETNALVVQENQSVLNFINARGLDLLVDLVEQQQPDDYCNTITRRITMSHEEEEASGSGDRDSASLTNVKVTHQESNLDLLSKLCEQRCRDEEWKRQQAAKEQNKRRLSFPPPAIATQDLCQGSETKLSSQHSQETPLSAGVDPFVRVNGDLSSCQLRLQSVDTAGGDCSDPESCVPLKKRAKRFSSLDPSLMQHLGMHSSSPDSDSSLTQGSDGNRNRASAAAPLITSSSMGKASSGAAAVDGGDRQLRTVPSITIQTSPKNSSGHPALTIKIKNPDVSAPVAEHSIPKPIKVLLKKRKAGQEERKSSSSAGGVSKEKSTIGSPDRKVMRKTITRKEDANRGSQVSLDLMGRKATPKKKKSSSKERNENEIKTKNKKNDASLDSGLSSKKKKKNEEERGANVRIAKTGISALLPPLCPSPAVEAEVDPYDFPSALTELDSSAEALNALKKHKKKRKKDKREKRKHRESEETAAAEEETSSVTATTSKPKTKKKKKREDVTDGERGSVIRHMSNINNKGTAGDSVTTSSPTRRGEEGIPSSRAAVVTVSSPAKSRKSPKKTASPAALLASRQAITTSTVDPSSKATALTVVSSPAADVTVTSVAKSCSDQRSGKVTRNSNSTSDQKRHRRRSTGQTDKSADVTLSDSRTPHEGHNNRNISRTTAAANGSSNQNHNQSNDWFAIRRSERIFFAHEFGSSFSLRVKKDSDEDAGDDRDRDSSDSGDNEDQKEEDRKKGKKTKARRSSNIAIRTNDETEASPESSESLEMTSPEARTTGEDSGIGRTGEKRRRDHKSKHHEHRHSHHKKHKKHKRSKRSHASDDEHEEDRDGDDNGSCCDDDYATSRGGKETQRQEECDADIKSRTKAVVTDSKKGSAARCHRDPNTHLTDEKIHTSVGSSATAATGKTEDSGEAAMNDKEMEAECDISCTVSVPPASAVGASDSRYAASSTGLSIRFTHVRRSLDSEASEATTVESNAGIFCWEFQGSPVKKSYQSATRTKNKTRTTIRKDFFNAVKRTRVASTPSRRISSESSPSDEDGIAASVGDDDEQEMILRVGECAIFCSSSPSSTPPVQSDSGSSVTTVTASPLAENRSRLPFIGRIDSFWRETSKTQSGNGLISPGSTSATVVKAESRVSTPEPFSTTPTTSTTTNSEKAEYNLRKGSPNKKTQQPLPASSSSTTASQKAVKVLEPTNRQNSVLEEDEKMMVKVRWFYHPLEAVTKSKKSDPMKVLCDPDGGLFESFTHSDENDVQTIASKCLVLPYDEFKQRKGKAAAIGDRRVYYLAGKYEPLVKELTFESGVP